MRLLYVADNGFSYHNGTFYYSRPNVVNSDFYLRYFDSIVYIARRSRYIDNYSEISTGAKVVLVSRYDIRGLKRAMISLSNEYDVVVVRSGFLGCFASKYAKSIGKILISFCGADPYEFYMAKESIIGHFIANIWRTLECKKMLMADYAHYCTETLYDRYPCNCPYLINSDVQISVNPDTIIKRRNKIRQKNTPYVIGLMGEYVTNDNKGISTAIKSLSLLDDNYLIEIVGAGDKSRYNKLIKSKGFSKRVRFIGYISDKDCINQWLDNIDIYIQPSMSEGLPRATIEAMSRGCPVIASNVCGLNDLLDSKYLVQPKDFINLSKKIRELIEPEEAVKAAEKNFQKAEEFSENIINKKNDEFFGYFRKS